MYVEATYLANWDAKKHPWSQLRFVKSSRSNNEKKKKNNNNKKKNKGKKYRVL